MIVHYYSPDLQPSQPVPGVESLCIKANYQLFRLKTEDILFIKALADYVIIKTTTGKYITLSTMKDMIDSLPSDKFARTHRSHIVNIKRINRIYGAKVVINHNGIPHEIPIGRVYKKAFKAILEK